MKKYQFKFFDVPPPPADLIAELNKEGNLGWRFVHGIGTPTGLKFLMERPSEEEVDQTDIDAYNDAQKEAELIARFGPGNARPLDSKISLR